MGDAVELGVDLFLLDDGWFGNKYPRNSDRQGLGDWERNDYQATQWHCSPHSSGQREGREIWIMDRTRNGKSEERTLRKA